ncbi:MAG: TrkA family potassium uptake protein [Armatimonadetes bacterium]|nr:TrkA family potassium uptake protein [Armatimonadota bacterium]
MFVLVVGGGKVGYYLVKSLIQNGHEVTLVEKDMVKCNRIVEDFGSLVVCGDGCDPAILQESGVERADVLVAVTGDDEDNLIICQVAKINFNVPHTIARVNNPKNVVIFKKLGIDSTISSTDIIQTMLEQEVAYKGVTPLLAFRKGGVEIVELAVQPNSPALGKKVEEIQLPPNCLLLAIIREESFIVPDNTSVVQQDDVVLALTRPDQLRTLTRSFVAAN